jgi:hypothetical protein
MIVAAAERLRKCHHQEPAGTIYIYEEGGRTERTKKKKKKNFFLARRREGLMRGSDGNNFASISQFMGLHFPLFF